MKKNYCGYFNKKWWNDFFRHGREFYSTTIFLTFLSPLYSTL